MRTTPVAIVLLCVSALGQVPVGQAVNGSISTTNPLLAFVDRAGYLTRVTGASLPSFNAVAIDPIDGDLWLGAWQSGAVRRARLSGALIVAEPIAVTAPIASVAAIAFDVDGHALVVGGSASTTDGVFRIDRNTGAVTRIFGGPGSGIVDSGGRFDVGFPGFVMPSGFPGFAQFLAGTLDQTTLALKLSAPVARPAN